MVELMKRVPLYIREALVVFKLSYVILLTLYGHFLKLSLELFFIFVTSCRLKAKNWRKNVHDATLRIVTIVLAWALMYHNEYWERDVASNIV